MLSLSNINIQPLSTSSLRSERQNHSLHMATQSWNSSKELQDGDLENEVHAWRQPLKAWLSICYQNETFYRVIDFLLVTLKDAEKKMQSYDSKSSQKKDITVIVNPCLLPLVFRKENWEKFLINLGFVLEMPDTLPLYNVTLVSVLLSASISIDLLMEIRYLLTYLKELPFFSVRTILSLNQNEGNSLFRALTDVCIHHLNLENSLYNQLAEILYNQKPKFMEELGFSKSSGVLQWRKTPEKERRMVMYMFLLKMFFSDELSEIKSIEV